jgi:hypothetical protein
VPFELIFILMLYLTFGAFLVEDRKEAAGYPISRWEKSFVLLFAPSAAVAALFLYVIPEYLFLLAWKSTRKWRTNRA